MKKYKFTNNLGLKIVALVFAAFLWLTVVNIDDPVESKTFRSIPVSVQNAEVVTNEGKTYKILDDTQAVTVVVKAKRSILTKLSSDDILAVADMSEMQIKSLVPIQVFISGYETDDFTAVSTPGNLRVKIEDQTKNTFPLTVSASGNPRDGYVVGEMTTNPEKITVRGPESTVSSIDRAVAKVDVSGLSRSGELAAELIYYDSNGNVVDKTQLTDNLGEEGVSVNVQILNTKTVPISFKVYGKPEDGYIYAGLVCEPDEVQVCGTLENLAFIDRIEVMDTNLDITGAMEKQEFTVDISPYLPENIRLVDESASSVLVTVTIEREGSRTIEFPVESIRINNLADGLSVSFNAETDIPLQFQGIQEVLDVLDIKNAVSINLKNMKAGEYEVEVNVELTDGVTLSGKPTVKVTLTEKEDQSTDKKGQNTDKTTDTSEE